MARNDTKLYAQLMGLDVEGNFGRETGRAIGPDGLINHCGMRHEYNVRGQKFERDRKRRDEFKRLNRLRGLQGNGTMCADGSVF